MLQNFPIPVSSSLQPCGGDPQEPAFIPSQGEPTPKSVSEHNSTSTHQCKTQANTTKKLRYPYRVTAFQVSFPSLSCSRLYSYNRSPWLTPIVLSSYHHLGQGIQRSRPLAPVPEQPPTVHTEIGVLCTWKSPRKRLEEL